MLERLTQVLALRGALAYLRSEDGSGFTARAARERPERVVVQILHIEPGSLWENGYIDSFNGRLRDDLLNREVIGAVLEARVLCERWRRHCDMVRSHCALG